MMRDVLVDMPDQIWWWKDGRMCNREWRFFYAFFAGYFMNCGKPYGKEEWN